MDNGVSASDEREARQLLGMVVVLLLLFVAPIILTALEHVSTIVLSRLAELSVL